MTFAVAFELKPRAVEVYLDRVDRIRPELAAVDGLISDSHYRALSAWAGWCRYRFGATRKRPSETRGGNPALRSAE